MFIKLTPAKVDARPRQVWHVRNLVGSKLEGSCLAKISLLDARAVGKKKKGSVKVRK